MGPDGMNDFSMKQQFQEMQYSQSMGNPMSQGLLHIDESEEYPNNIGPTGNNYLIE